MQETKQNKQVKLMFIFPLTVRMKQNRILMMSLKKTDMSGKWTVSKARKIGLNLDKKLDIIMEGRNDKHKE